MDSRSQYRWLVESLRLVAASKEEQIGTLPEFVSVTDEVATSFGDAYLLVPQLVRAGLISESARQSIKRLDQWFSSVPGDSSIANCDALDDHWFWIRARILAKEALAELGEDLRPPDLGHMDWMES